MQERGKDAVSRGYAGEKGPKVQSKDVMTER